MLLRFTWFSLLLLDLVAGSCKRNRIEDVNTQGGLQKRARMEEVPVGLYRTDSQPCENPEKPKRKPRKSTESKPKPVAETHSLPYEALNEPKPISAFSPLSSMMDFMQDSGVQRDTPSSGTTIGCIVPAQPPEHIAGTPSPSPYYQFREGLKRITQDGKDVAVTLYETENFITDLPFLGCVLPSMQAGEQYFVPAFIQKILMPYWEHGSGYFREYEKFILGLSQEQFMPAMGEYLELLFLASILEQPMDAACTVVLGLKTKKLKALILELFGVAPPGELFRGSEALEKLKIRLVKHLRKIPAMLMIGHQWKFDAKMIATNIRRIASLDSVLLQTKQLQYDIGIDRLLGDIIHGIQLPNLSFTSISWIAWTLNPDFIWDFEKGTGKQVLLAKVRFDSARGKVHRVSPSRPRRRKPSMRDILKELEIREMRRKPGYVPFLPISRKAIAEHVLALVPDTIANGPRQTILRISDAPQTTSQSVIDERPSEPEQPEMSSPQVVNPDAITIDQEPPIKPAACLSEFPDDPLDLFGPDVVNTGGLFGDDDPFGFHGSIDPDVQENFDFFYNSYFDDE